MFTIVLIQIQIVTDVDTGDCNHTVIIFSPSPIGQQVSRPSDYYHVLLPPATLVSSSISAGMMVAAVGWCTCKPSEILVPRFVYQGSQKRGKMTILAWKPTASSNRVRRDANHLYCDRILPPPSPTDSDTQYISRDSDEA